MSEEISFVLGIVFGAGFVWITVLSQRIANRRGLKEYLCMLDSDSRNIIEGKIKQLRDLVENIAVMSNTKLFKTMWNDLLELQGFLSRMWKQN